MAINKKLFKKPPAEAGNGGAGSGNQEEGLILYLDANDVDSYDGDGSEWIDIKDHEYKPATNVSEHFNTVTYTGNGTTKNVTGVGFQPDLVWIKARSVGYDHQMHDSLRGAGYGLLTNLTAVEGNYSTVNSFDSDGFSVDASSYVGTNANNATFVAWCFKAGGAPTATNIGGQTPTSGSKMVDGSIVTDNYPTADRYPTKQSVNNKLGFSVTEYTGGSSGDSVPHGLDTTPEMYIIKQTDSTGNWWVYTVEGGDFQYLKLNGNDAAIDADQYYARPTGSLIEQGQASSSTNIMYAFASKRGVSKVGSYTGTGAAGNKVYTGFEPAFVMLKVTSANSGWVIIDSKRNDKYLLSNTTAAESSLDIIDFNRDGFTFKGNSMNGSGNSHIYLAFAKDTNETSLIPDTDLELHLDAGDDTTVSASTWSDKANSNDGTLSGFSSTLTDFYEKELGNYIDFDGTNDKITIEDNTNYSQLSVEVWVNPDNVGTGYYNNFIGRGYYTSLSDRKFWILSNPNKSYVDWNVTYNSNSVKITSSQSLPSNTWTHILATLDSSGNTKLYQNGELVASGTGATALNIPSNYRTVIGERPEETGFSTGWYAGKIGQVRIYSTALTQDQIRQNYNFTKNDYPNGYNGTISGATWNSSGYFDFGSSSDKIVIDNNNFYSNFSVSLWVQFDDVSPVSGYGHNVLSKNQFYAGSHSGFPFTIVNDVANTIKAALSYANDYSYDVEVTGTIASGTWYHVAVTAEKGDKLKLYLTAENGTFNTTPTSEATYTGTVIDGPNLNYTIGNAAQEYGGGSGKGFLDGKVSKVKMYDKVLTASEISTQFSEGK